MITEQMKREAVDLYLKNEKVKDILSKIGISETSFYKILRKHNIKIREHELKIEIITHKQCNKCDILKPVIEFHFKNSNKHKNKSKYSNLCKPCYSEKGKEQWKNRTPEQIASDKRTQREWRSKNRERINKRNREKFKNDPILKVRQYMRSRVSELLKNKKCAKSIELLGCTLDFFKSYLEERWQSGMTWDNYGFGDDKWHVDHIVPCSAFDFSKEDHQRKCFHYSNLQPLWQKDNLSKHTKVSDDVKNSLFLDEINDSLEL